LTCLLNRLLSVLKAAARAIAGLRRSGHITDVLTSFHWLRALERIKFKLAVIVYQALHGTAPQYLLDRLQYVVDLLTRRDAKTGCARRPPVFSMFARRSVSLLAIALLLLLAHDSGTVY